MIYLNRVSFSLKYASSHFLYKYSLSYKNILGQNKMKREISFFISSALMNRKGVKNIKENTFVQFQICRIVTSFLRN